MTEKVIVTVKEGKVRGFKTKSAYAGTEFYTFLGIPYGQTTGGSARYKDPVKVKPWSNIFDATAMKGGCTQFSLIKRDFIGSEDCLYNNIYTPKIPSKDDPLKAVIVNLHPGGFFHGSPDPDHFGAPEFIMHHDIVYVCIGCRLHLFGYLNLHMETCSGNQGLKDIILGLEWVKENISVFGGDPDNVTLLGSSSGSAIVHLLLLSPLARGLYHKVILMGMYVFSPVLVTLNDHTRVNYEVAKMIGYKGPPGEDKKLLKFFKSIKFPTLARARPEHFFSNSTLQVYPASPFLPSAEPGENSPIPVPPQKLITSMNRVPMMIGFCQREACMALGLINTFKKSISSSFYKAVHQNPWGWGAALTEDQLKQLQKEVENYYLGGESIQTAEESVLCDIITDLSLSDVYDSLINVVSEDLPSSVYVYNFLYDGKLCTMKSKIQNLMKKELKGAFHAADYSYWCYGEDLAGKNMGNIQPKDRQIIDRITGMITKFAKTCDPNCEELPVYWKPTTRENPSHLIIDETLQSRDELLNGDRMEFWHKLKIKFQKKSEDSKK